MKFERVVFTVFSDEDKETYEWVRASNHEFVANALISQNTHP